MGPRTIVRGNTNRHGPHLPTDRRFNGAADDRPRKFPVLYSTRDEAVHASMGPRTIVRGNARIKAFVANLYRASMGPRTIVRGNVNSPGGSVEGVPASMGPRTIVRGNAIPILFSP